MKQLRRKASTPRSLSSGGIAADAVTYIVSGTHSNPSISAGPSISYDTNGEDYPSTPVVTITAKAKPVRVSGVVTCALTLGATTVAQIGWNLLIYRGTTLIFNKNMNGVMSTVSGTQQKAVAFPFEVLDAPSAGSTVYSYRLVANWVNAAGGTVTATSVTGSRSINMIVTENRTST